MPWPWPTGTRLSVRVPAQDPALRLWLNPCPCADREGDGCGMGRQHKKSPAGLERHVASCIPLWPRVPEPFRIRPPLLHSLLPSCPRCGPVSNELPRGQDDGRGFAVPGPSSPLCLANTN